MHSPLLAFTDICVLPCRLLSHILDFFAIAGKFAGGMNASDFPPTLGFRAGDKGTHSSRTMMLAELSALFATCTPECSREDYFTAAINDNALGKATASTRRLTVQRLSELYALDRAIPIFRALRRFWDLDVGGQRLIALLVCLARDPLLRCSVPSVLNLREGQNFDRDAMKDAVSKTVRDRLNDSILDKVVRNAASSWTQSGHLAGRTFKKRRLVRPTRGPVALALFLGYLQGIRGPGILQTFWCRVLDAPPAELSRIAATASMLGGLRFRQAGDVVDVSFPSLVSLTEMERAA